MGYIHEFRVRNLDPRGFRLPAMETEEQAMPIQRTRLTHEIGNRLHAAVMQCLDPHAQLRFHQPSLGNILLNTETRIQDLTAATDDALRAVLTLVEYQSSERA